MSKVKEEKINRDKCIDLWKWLAKTGKESKEKYFNNAQPLNYCYACEEVKYLQPGFDNYYFTVCKNCPVDWGTKRYFAQCENKGSSYRAWVYASTVEDRKRAAKEVLQCIENTWE